MGIRESLRLSTVSNFKDLWISVFSCPFNVFKRPFSSKVLAVEALEGTLNKEKALEGAFSGHCQISRSPVDSSILRTKHLHPVFMLGCGVSSIKDIKFDWTLRFIVPCSIYEKRGSRRGKAAHKEVRFYHNKYFSI